MSPQIPTCPECGHLWPPEDPTDAQVNAFVDDDSTDQCPPCSMLWIELMGRMVVEILGEKR